MTIRLNVRDQPSQRNNASDNYALPSELIGQTTKQIQNKVNFSVKKSRRTILTLTKQMSSKIEKMKVKVKILTITKYIKTRNVSI